MENNIEGLDQPFTYDIEILGQKYTSELVPEGSDIIIDEENKLEYVKRIGQMKMKEEINEEIEVL